MALVSQAVLLAAGLGTRMRPLTLHMPKPLVPVAGCPLIEGAFQLVEEASLTHCAMNSHYLGEQIAHYLASQQQKGRLQQVTLSPEEVLLDSGGGIAQALTLLPPTGENPLEDAVFILNTDCLFLQPPETPPLLQTLQTLWNPKEMDALWVLTPTAHAHGYSGNGDAHLEGLSEGRGLVTRLPSPRPYVFTGLQVIKKHLFKGYPPQTPFSLRKIWEPIFEKSRIYGTVFSGEWVHVGTPEGVQMAEEFLRLRHTPPLKNATSALPV